MGKLTRSTLHHLDYGSTSSVLREPILKISSRCHIREIHSNSLVKFIEYLQVYQNYMRFQRLAQKSTEINFYKSGASKIF